MPVNGLTIGNDLSLVVIDTQQGVLTFCNILSSSVKEIVQKLKSVGMDGSVRYASLPEGWNWDITLDAGDGKLMDYFAIRDQQFARAGTMAEIKLIQTVQWTPTNTSSYQFTGGAASLTNAGQFTGNEFVKQSLAIEFSLCTKRS